MMWETRRSADIHDHVLRATTNPIFRFVVEVGAQKIGAFTECTLPAVEWETLDVQEGGLNDYVHSLLGRRKKSTLTLKNGLGYGGDLIKWYLESSGKPEPRQVTVTLFNSKCEPVMCWQLDRCVPVKWSAPQLSADSNSIAIQTLELACGDIEIERPKKTNG